MTNINSSPLKLAVVGHTNTGKTSILRTLLRDKYFGEVKNETATTRHVERATITDVNSGEDLLYLFDTPGLEDATGVMDWLEDNTSTRKDGIERLQHFLAYDNHTANTEFYDFSQEQKVIKQVLQSDVAIYVIDSREPVLSKYRDELAILSWTSIPVMPVFNFINPNLNTSQQHLDTAPVNHIKDWQNMLARNNLHISTQFDSVAFEFTDEMRLWQNLATMLTGNNPENSQILSHLIHYRQNNWHALYDEATIIIADFLLNVASFVKEIDEKDDPLPVLSTMQESVRQAERQMQQQLLDLYKFYDSAVSSTPLNLNEYQQDPFDSEVLKSYGIRTSSGLATGALIGVGVDMMALGTTMGLGTAIGGLLGGLLPNSRNIVDMVKGTKRLYIDPATITLLATRALALLYSLRHRGHANTTKIIEPKQQRNMASRHDKDPNKQQQGKQQQNSQEQAVQSPFMPWSIDKLPTLLKKARNRQEWSSLNGGNAQQAQLLRKDMAWKLAHQISNEH